MIELTETDAERIAIISDGCKVSQESAERIWLSSQQLAPNHLMEKVARIKELALAQKVILFKKTGKDFAGGCN
ncbi:MAG: hypothetical protein WC714_29015 [Candidatus Obscuribacterales bacterium]|jgi:hypothetical protein